MASIEIGAIRWVPGDGRTTSGWSEPVTVTTTRAVGLDAVLVPGRERRALIHVPREEWTPVHLETLCLCIAMWLVVGVVVNESAWRMWLANDPDALPTLIAVIGAGLGADAWLRRRLPPRK